MTYLKNLIMIKSLIPSFVLRGIWLLHKLLEDTNLVQSNNIDDLQLKILHKLGNISFCDTSLLA